MSIISNEHQHGSPFSLRCPACDRTESAPFDVGDQCPMCRTPMVEAAATQPVDLDGLELPGLVRFLRENFVNDGAEGESAHRLCMLAERMAAELRTLRARVGELETQLNPPLDAEDERILAMSDEEIIAEANLSPEEWERLGAVGSATRDWAAMVTKERRRAESAEARVKELEASIARIHSFAGRGDGHGSLAATEACLADTFTMLRIDLDNAEKDGDAAEARITDLESKLAAAREEQAKLRACKGCQNPVGCDANGTCYECAGLTFEEIMALSDESKLEAKVREALGERLDSLHIAGNDGVDPDAPGHWHWFAEWSKDDRAVFAHQQFAATLPALLRAILEVEAKGG